MSNASVKFHGPFGVLIEIQGSLIMLIGLFYLVTGDITRWLLLCGIVIGSIFVHEAGHAFGALVQGVPVKRIVIHGGGGFCENAGLATRKQSEFIVAMGPITNLTIWASLSFLDPCDAACSQQTAWAVDLLATMNLFLALFNLLPLQPLDGGKLLYLYLMRIVSVVTATRICGYVGLVGVLLWLPLLYFSLVTFGFILLFFPSIRLHWNLARVKPDP